MILINASSYVNAEFEAEIGRIPPCMLPIGNKNYYSFKSMWYANTFPMKRR